MKGRNGVFGVPPIHTTAVLYPNQYYSITKKKSNATYPTAHRFDTKLYPAIELQGARVRVLRSIRVPKMCHESDSGNISTSQVNVGKSKLKR